MTRLVDSGQLLSIVLHFRASGSSCRCSLGLVPSGHAKEWWRSGMHFLAHHARTVEILCKSYIKLDLRVEIQSHSFLFLQAGAAMNMDTPGELSFQSDRIARSLSISTSTLVPGDWRVRPIRCCSPGVPDFGCYCHRQDRPDEKKHQSDSSGSIQYIPYNPKTPASLDRSEGLIP